MFSEGFRRVPMVLAYYEVLNADANFAAAFRELDERVGDCIRAGAGDPDSGPDALEAFAADWHLPTDRGQRDLRWSLKSRPPRTLRWAGGGEYPPIDPGQIVPSTPAAFTYDPSRMTRTQLRAAKRAAAAEVERSIADQANVIDAAFAAQGYAPIPPHHLSDARLRQGALRLYRRAVLGWSAARIAERENEADEAGVASIGPDAVARTVRHWAEGLKVPVKTEV